jgi:hypothetical protein
MVMRIELDEKPNKPIIIEGFPGFGFVSTIATEFLVKHLNAKPIGRIVSEKITPMAAIHKSRVIYPLEIFFDKKTNIVIVQAITPVEGLEWDIADTLIRLAKQLKAKEFIGLEGVSSAPQIKNPEVFFYANDAEKHKNFQEMQIKPLDEGIIVGVTGALMMRMKETPMSCFFVETHTDVPDNNGAAKLIATLDKYLGLDVDPKPLMEKAREVEGKLKDLLTKLNEVKADKETKQLSYTG